MRPTYNPTSEPSIIPTYFPSEAPTLVSSDLPIMEPSTNPTYTYTGNPTFMPSTTIPRPTTTTNVQTLLPTSMPTMEPSFSPTIMTLALTDVPTFEPIIKPTYEPSVTLSLIPTFSPTLNPSYIPTVVLSIVPSFVPSFVPTSSPTHSFASFNVTQIFKNVSASDLKSANGTNAIKQAVSSSLNGKVSTNDVVVLNITSSSSSSSSTASDRFRKLTILSNYVIVIYEIKIDLGSNTNALSTYSQLIQELTNAISCGNFTVALKAASKTYNIPNLAYVDASSSVSISSLIIPYTTPPLSKTTSKPALINIPKSSTTESTDLEFNYQFLILIIGLPVSLLILYCIFRYRKKSTATLLITNSDLLSSESNSDYYQTNGEKPFETAHEKFPPLYSKNFNKTINGRDIFNSISDRRKIANNYIPPILSHNQDHVSYITSPSRHNITVEELYPPHNFSIQYGEHPWQVSKIRSKKPVTKN